MFPKIILWIFIDDFMEKVQKYPCLYYQFCEDFEEKYVNLSSFKVIGDKFGLPPHKVKKRYKSIRISHAIFEEEPA